MTQAIMTKTLTAIVLTLSIGACSKQANDKNEAKTETTSTTTQSIQTAKEQLIPAMMARSFKVKLDQPKICENNAEMDNTLICTHYEVIGLKSNIPWIDQLINQEIHKNFSASFQKPTNEQIKQNQKNADGINNWSQSIMYRFAGQFGRYVQIVETGSEYSGGAHGMAYITNYVYDLKNKKRMAINDIVIAGKSSALKDELWKSYLSYCQDNEMEPVVDKKDFTISPNFYINTDGTLTFDYQLYEVAPYAAGFVSLTVDNIKNIIQPDFLPPQPQFEQEY